MGRLAAAIVAWKECLTGGEEDLGIDTTMDTTPASSQPQFKAGGTPELEVQGIGHLSGGGWVWVWFIL